MRRRIIARESRQWFRRVTITRKQVMYSVAGLLVLIIVIQFAYPRNRLVPFTVRDGVAVGHWKKNDAAWELDQRYSAIQAPIYLGSATKPHATEPLARLGVSVKNDTRMAASNYPWYMRLIPSSLLWYHVVAADKGPKYAVDTKKQAAFIDDLAGKNCHVAPVNASLKAAGDTLKVVAAKPGGECNIDQVKQVVGALQPRLQEKNIIHIPVTKKPAAITDASAAAVAQAMKTRVGAGIQLEAGGKPATIAPKDLFSWLTFATDTNELKATVDTTKAKDFFDKAIAPLVARPAGVTTITTQDFAEISRVEGARGQALDVAKTADSLTQFINGGEAPTVQLATTSPQVKYNRSYSSSNAGLSALMANFANSHPGTYGVAMYELGGERRHADYNGSQSFVTASTYKLYVAYSTIRRVDSGQWSWGDANIAGGRNRGQCFDDMIVKSDNDCAVALLHAIGYTTITNEVHALGLNNTSFISDDTPHSTATDEATFLASLETNQLPISADGRARLLGDMQRQIYRQGIPAGVSAPVADKVGFLWNLLHDAAIVYSPKGTYVLVILTDNSSWPTIADLAKQIEALR